MSTIAARPSRKRVGLILLVALLAAAGAAFSARSSATAQDRAGTTLRFSERDRDATFTHIRNTKAGRRANSQGDVLAYASPLLDAGGTRVGKLDWACTTTSGARSFMNSTATCHGVAALRDGTLTLQFNLSPAATTTTGAVTGGTGAYANARGVVVSTGTKIGSEDTITLVEPAR